MGKSLVSFLTHGVVGQAHLEILIYQLRETTPNTLIENR